MARSDRRRVFLALLGAGALPVVLACNDLIGLSDYERAECSGGGLCSDAAGVDVFTPPPDAGKDAQVGPIDASGTAPVSWARFVMPNYPDAAPDATIPTYSPNGDGGVVDSVSKLVWTASPAIKGATTFANAQAACAKLPGGKWRLPSRIELVTLLDLTPGKSPTIDGAAFKGTEAIEYWTSSEVRPAGAGSAMYWTIDFASGGLNKRDGTSGQAGVRCILGGAT